MRGLIAQLRKYHLVFHQIRLPGGTACRLDAGQIGEREGTCFVPQTEGAVSRMFLCVRIQVNAYLCDGT